MNEHHRYYFDGRCSNLSENISARSVQSDGHQEGTQGGPSRFDHVMSYTGDSAHCL